MQRIDPYIYVTKGISDIYYYLDKIKYKINQGGRQWKTKLTTRS